MKRLKYYIVTTNNKTHFQVLISKDPFTYNKKRSTEVDYLIDE